VNKNSLLEDEFLKEFDKLTQPVLETEYRRRGIIPKLPKRPESPDCVPEDDGDPFVVKHRINVIEQGVKAGKVIRLFEALEERYLTKDLYLPSQRQEAIDNFEIWLLTLVAKDKLRLNELGLMKLGKWGDLRTATLIDNEVEWIFRILRLKKGRKHPGAVEFIQREAAKMQSSFFLRLGRILKKPGIEIEHLGSNQHWLLLDHWATPWLYNKATIIPPLCFFSDPAIAKFVAIELKLNEITPAKIRKMWERLGLRKANKISVTDFNVKNGRAVLEVRDENNPVHADHLKRG
jgi:hypothetical protein